MKNIARKLSALLLVFVVSMAALCPAFAASASLPSLPSGQCVVDDANVLSSSTVQTITDLNAQLESSCSGAQIGVLTGITPAAAPQRNMPCRRPRPGALVLLPAIMVC